MKTNRKTKYHLGTLTLLACAMAALASPAAEAKIQIMATVPDLAALASQVGGDQVSAEAFAKGTQDPHFIEAKPSFMSKANHADLVISMGLELEIGWLPSILKGARNPKVMPGMPGYLELGGSLDPLEVASGKITRSEGDVHPDGNPHFNLDPIRMGKAGVLIGERLAELDPPHAADYRKRAADYQASLTRKTQAWQARLDKTGIKQIITYHKTLTYFFNRFKLGNPAILEPKPGIPPTSAHTIEVIALMKREKIPLVLVENFYDSTIGNRIHEELPNVRIQSVATLVGGEAGVSSTDDLIEHLVRAIEGK